ncbi:Phosphatidylinositol anchor biosynthesis protein PIGW/GWT1 [Dillenia turbinata]|uniref:Phosphatidylinositol anchor biosynthesis protein PIGW/GWT1 n=1 Tax=Dillenia turbinata TaxID=194707 RepID=A0AAN8VH44_9MAGN
MDSSARALNPHKHLKEQFVSNLNGSSMLEIAALSVVIPAIILSFNFERPVTDASVEKNDGDILCGKIWRDCLATMAVDFLFIICPILLSLTVLAEWTPISAILLATLVLFRIAGKGYGSSYLKGAPESFCTLRTNISSYRVAVMIATCLCILAVDFNIFPRRYAKTETYGTSWDAITHFTYHMLSSLWYCGISTGDAVLLPCCRGKDPLVLYLTSNIINVSGVQSLYLISTLESSMYQMDVGVGCFVLANSLVSRQARNIPSSKWKNSVLSASPLIILGFGCLLSTVGVDYQFRTVLLVFTFSFLIELGDVWGNYYFRMFNNERRNEVHVGEYGVHWNFFFTLAAISILTSTINIPPRYCGAVGFLVLIGYQICLLQGLNTYLLSEERGMDIISLNKEGIFSIFGIVFLSLLLGYWGMYLIGVYLGNYLFFGNQSTGRLNSSHWARIRVWILSLFFWMLTVILDVERVSRRMCNLAYVTLVLAQSFQALGTLMLSDLIPGCRFSKLEEAFDRNLLAAFLLANMLTGLVNLSLSHQPRRL